jgi:hypothetical protein
VRRPILEASQYGIEGECFWGRSTDPSHPWLTFSNFQAPELDP